MKTHFVFGEAFSSLGRNVTMTTAMIITTAVSLALLATGVLVTEQTSRTRDLCLNRVEVQVELNEQISAEDQTCSSSECAKVVTKLEEADGIESVTLRNRQQNFDHFVEMFKDSDPVLVENATPESLLAPIMMRLSGPTDISPLDSIRELPQVDHVTDQHKEVGTAAQSLDPVRNTTFLLAAVQAVAVVFLIANMVQITTFSCRKEVGIMRMVGTSRWFTQTPLVSEAVIAPLIDGVPVIGALFLGKATVADPALSSLYKTQLLAPLTNGDIGVAVPIVVIIGMIFAGLVTQVTLRLYSRD